MTARPSVPVAGRPVFVALGIVGGALIAAGWYQASDTVVFGDQVRSGVLSSAGLAAVTAAVALWTMAGRRAVERRLAGLLRSSDDLRPTAATAVSLRSSADLGPAAAMTASARPAPDLVVATAAMRWYHRPSCPLAAGKPARPAGRSDHEGAGRRPCGVCQP